MKGQPMNFHNELETAIGATKLAANLALTFYNQPVISFHNKGIDKDPVTEADIACEKLIKDTILQKFPNAQFMAEESGGELNHNELWVVDPIDGTQNFVRHVPFWGPLIAFVKDSQPVVGVSYLPLLGELLYASLGSGSYCNDERITVSTVNTIRESFFNHSSLKHIVNRLPGFLELAKEAWRVRGFGDSYGFHLLALGKSESMIDGHMSPWDMAARKIIIEEAGAKVTNFNGEKWSFSDDNCIATNGIIHDEVLRILHKE